jgi:hypothetical protein
VAMVGEVVESALLPAVGCHLSGELEPGHPSKI